MGTALLKWTTMALGANNNWGWHGEFDDCHQGYCGTKTIIPANRAEVVKEVGDVPPSMRIPVHTAMKHAQQTRPR